jgi:hypothetical protein
MVGSIPSVLFSPWSVRWSLPPRDPVATTTI